ncbi:uncharacterized protein KY384_006970 [Bacidia gigantensis]|uniref:uncharacterized protein n=1 Tax=Bacidia gigantensis TaxID=2732470 RepID=UPI001D04DC88|nr:uncharacterized protein KY384_006970 [Bacidia gigantensis]KAG8528054.1 hypothetical protein KY384_006970 [Bacidia gigantensis]
MPPMKRTMLLFGIVLATNGSSKLGSPHSSQDAQSPHTPANQSFHILIPATKSDVNLCKTLLSGSILDYPPPVIIAWDQTIDPDKQEGMWGGGTHLFKISKVLEWLQNLPPDRDEDLVMMMDGYDIWFQLSKEILIQRYHEINAEANARIRRRIGRAADIEGIKQTIVFGSGKRCFPNEIHTVACWPLPPSPLPEDMWDGNTDTTIGSFPNAWAATRQKFLNSGIIIGPAKDMRALFARAATVVNELGQDPEPDDNGSRWSEKAYHSSDQSVFNVIFGNQEFQREVIRIRHISWFHNPMLKAQQMFGKDLSATTETLEGNAIVNILDPPWSHAQIPHLPGKPLEFGIGLDYWSSLSFQTANSERNGGWLTYSKGASLEDQVEHKDRWDCKPHLRPDLPADILASPAPVITSGGAASPPSNQEQQQEQHEQQDQNPSERRDTSLNPVSWDSVPLYTNICAGTIPVMVHLNGNKQARDTEWANMWYQPSAEQLHEASKPKEGESMLKGAENGGRKEMEPGSAFADTGLTLNFGEICKDWDFS